MSEFVVRARFDERTINVYQAYRPEIGYAALLHQRFVPPFSMNRMTWIKPSFNWMMYRSDYGRREGQTVVLRISMTRDGFDWALAHAVLSAFEAAVHGSREQWKEDVLRHPVRVQWDPERDWRLQPIAGMRAIQIGLSSEALERYVEEWIVSIEDVTHLAHRIAHCREEGMLPGELPDQSEHPYPLSNQAARKLVPGFSPQI